MCLDPFCSDCVLTTLHFEQSNKPFQFTDVTYKSVSLSAVIQLLNHVLKLLLLMNFINTGIIQVLLT
jgi:hypothetical protein